MINAKLTCRNPSIVNYVHVIARWGCSCMTIICTWLSVCLFISELLVISIFMPFVACTQVRTTLTWSWCLERRVTSAKVSLTCNQRPCLPASQVLASHVRIGATFSSSASASRTCSWLVPTWHRSQSYFLATLSTWAFIWISKSFICRNSSSSNNQQ